MDEKRRVLHNSSILTDGNRISQIADDGKIAKDQRPGEVIDATGKVVLPGLIDTHCHLNQTILKSLVDGLKLFDWLLALSDRTGPHFEPDALYYSTLLGQINLLHCGCTCVVDNFPSWRTTSLRDSSVKASLDSGMRTVKAEMMRDADLLKKGRPPTLETDEAVRRTREMLHKWHRAENGRLLVRPAGGTLHSTSLEYLEEATRLAEEYDTGMCLHMHESKDEIEGWKKLYGMPPIKYLGSKAKVLGPRFLAAHCVWCDDEDIRILKRTGTCVSHNPVSNMFLASGVAPIPKMLSEGITVGLGDDGAACSGSQSMFEVMKSCILLHRAATCDPKVMTAERALELATVEGAASIGLSGQIGSLEEGKKADLTVLDLRKIGTCPRNNLLSSIIYSAGPANVEMVMVDGEIILQNGSLKRLNEVEIVNRAEAAAEKLIQKAGITELV